MSDELEGLRAELRSLRAREGEVLREAADLRARAQPVDQVRALTSEAERLRARINAVAREIEARQLH